MLLCDCKLCNLKVDVLYENYGDYCDVLYVIDMAGKALEYEVYPDREVWR